MSMNITIPKGAYHSHCRNSNTAKSTPHSHRVRSMKINQMHKNFKKLQDFGDFQSYLMYLHQKESQSFGQPSSRTTQNFRSARSSRPKTQVTQRQSDNKLKQEQVLIKPFFPFFKCRIQGTQTPSADIKFRINHRKFKLNYRIIEENMGKGEQKFYW